MTQDQEAELREMRQLEHNHLVRFLGISQNYHDFFQVWKYCERSTIEDVLSEHSLRIDANIMISMILNIAEVREKRTILPRTSNNPRGSKIQDQ